MSIEAELQRCCRDGWLELLHTDYIGGPTRRLYVTPHVLKALEPPWDTPYLAGRWGIVRADLEHFILGEPMTVPPDNQIPETARLARLIPPPEGEIWELRCRDPRPAVRVFGRFAAFDAFVAMLWEYREPLGPFGSPAWHKYMRWTARYWSTLFPQNDPLTQRSYPDGYLSNAVLERDA